MATQVIDHVGDLGIAQMCRRAVPHQVRRCTERRHAVAPAEHGERVVFIEEFAALGIERIIEEARIKS